MKKQKLFKILSVLATIGLLLFQLSSLYIGKFESSLINATIKNAADGSVISINLIKYLFWCNDEKYKDTCKYIVANDFLNDDKVPESEKNKINEAINKINSESKTDSESAIIAAYISKAQATEKNFNKTIKDQEDFIAKNEALIKKLLILRTASISFSYICLFISIIILTIDRKKDHGRKNMAKFQPKPGQIDYTNIRRAPVINCVVKYKDKILIVKRSAKLNFYPNYWNGISGFLDDNKTIEEKAREEVKEELGIVEEDIIYISQGDIFKQEEPKYNKTWIVHHVLVEVKYDKIKLDWEAQEYRWILPEEAKNFDLLPGFEKVLGKLFILF